MAEHGHAALRAPADHAAVGYGLGGSVACLSCDFGRPWPLGQQRTHLWICSEVSPCAVQAHPRCSLTYPEGNGELWGGQTFPLRQSQDLSLVGGQSIEGSGDDLFEVLL